MKILLVIDQFDEGNNGTTISARRFAETLQSHGNEVRVVCTGESNEQKYGLDEFVVPIFDGLIKSQGMMFAKPCKTTLQAAISWADVVHFLMPFALSIKGRKIAQQLSVPHTAAFHVQPENITSSIKMGNCKAVNKALYRGFRDVFYNKIRHIHCPSNFIAGQLRQNGYTAKLHVISNGVDNDFVYKKRPKPAAYADKLAVVMVGRYSVEKRQDVLIEAIRHSQFCDRIQLILAGQGPREEALKKQAQSLPVPPIFGFYTKQQLIDMLATCDLYVHAADIEIEAISCMEAFATGLVPVIADSPRSATPQFALDERSLFEAGNSEDLARKMDYWLSHEQERREMEQRYAAQGQRYHIDACVSDIEEMFREEMAGPAYG